MVSQLRSSSLISVFPYTLGDAVSDGLIQLPWYIAADVTPPSEELMQWVLRIGRTR